MDSSALFGRLDFLRKCILQRIRYWAVRLDDQVDVVERQSRLSTCTYVFRHTKFSGLKA
jgi:hypothetical protein